MVKINFNENSTHISKRISSLQIKTKKKRKENYI